jgi:hypothetical protein
MISADLPSKIETAKPYSFGSLKSITEPTTYAVPTEVLLKMLDRISADSDDVETEQSLSVHCARQK